MMIAEEKNYQSYLLDEVELAGERYDHTVEKVFALLGGPNVQPGPDLVHATQALREDLRLYAGAIRRMATIVCHPSTHS
jgi:hypothetical protein